MILKAIDYRDRFNYELIYLYTSMILTAKQKQLRSMPLARLLGIRPPYVIDA